jgi:hypothetical protein
MDGYLQLARGMVFSSDRAMRQLTKMLDLDRWDGWDTVQVRLDVEQPIAVDLSLSSLLVVEFKAVPTHAPGPATP